MTETGDHSSSAPRAASVSVLVTTFNHARYVEEALESLRRQSSRDFEVIITDDASTDGCAEIIVQWLERTGFAAQFIRNPVNRGICANRNAALARASGTFVCSLSGDDAYAPERIERQLACFRAQPDNVCAVYSDALLVDAAGVSMGRTMLEVKLAGGAPPQGELFARLVWDNFLPAPAVMVRKSAIVAVGGYDESLFYEDFDMWLRLSSRFRFVHLPGELVRFRFHSDSMSNNPKNSRPMLTSRTKILQKWLDVKLDRVTRNLVLDALLWAAMLQLHVQDVTGARETLSALSAADRRPSRRWMARAAMLPPVGVAVRFLLPFYRRARALMGRSRY